MASFLETRDIRRHEVKRLVVTQTYALKDHACQLAAREGRPYQYFGERTRKEASAPVCSLPFPTVQLSRSRGSGRAPPASHPRG